MKAFEIVLKIVAALAVVAGIVYVIITYGDKIVAWCKKTFGKFFCCEGEACCCEGDCCEEACCEEEARCCEAAPAEEAVPGTEVVEETDFEG